MLSLSGSVNALQQAVLKIHPVELGEAAELLRTASSELDEFLVQVQQLLDRLED